MRQRFLEVILCVSILVGCGTMVGPVLRSPKDQEMSRRTVLTDGDGKIITQFAMQNLTTTTGGVVTIQVSELESSVQVGGVLAFTTYPGLSSVSVAGATFTTDAWETLQIAPEMAMRNLSTLKPDYAVFQGATKTYLFDPDTDESVTCTLQLPRKWKLQTDLTCQIHWTPTTTHASVVRWAMEYSQAAVGAVFGATTTIYVVQAGSGTAYLHQIANFPDISLANVSTISPILPIRVFRDADTGFDNYSGDAALLFFGCAYQVDGLGSDTVDAKSY